MKIELEITTKNRNGSREVCATMGKHSAKSLTTGDGQDAIADAVQRAVLELFDKRHVG